MPTTKDIGMTDIEKTNAVLKELGSPLRAHVGAIVSEAVSEIVSLLPAYIDRKISERLWMIAQTATTTPETER